MRLQWLSVCLAAIVVFAAALPNGWLGDDQILLEERLDGVTWSSLPAFLGQSYWGPLHPASGLYRPTALALLGAQRLLFGHDLASYRAVTVCLHACAALLVLSLLRQSHPRGALAGALLFAVHPIHAEAVTTIYGQQDVAAGVAALAALRVHSAWWPRPSVVVPAATAGLYLVGMTCKEQVVLLPLLLWGWQHHGRRLPSRSWRVSSAPWLASAAVVYVMLRLYVLGWSAIPLGDATVAAGYPWWARSTLVVTTVATYLRLLILPWGQTTYYGHLRNSILGFPASEVVVLWVVIAVLLVLWRRTRDDSVIKAALVLATFLLPVANIVPIGTVVAERCLYLPVLAVSVLAALAWQTYQGARPRTATALLIATVLVCGLLATRVAMRWRTPLGHWRATVADHPGSPKAHATVAILLLEDVLSEPHRDDRALRLDEADAELSSALALNPHSPDAWRGRAVLHAVRGECAQAADALGRPQVSGPDDFEVLALVERACR